jgi:hypothetical protein
MRAQFVAKVQDNSIIDIYMLMSFLFSKLMFPNLYDVRNSIIVDPLPIEDSVVVVVVDLAVCKQKDSDVLHT